MTYLAGAQPLGTLEQWPPGSQVRWMVHSAGRGCVHSAGVICQRAATQQLTIDSFCWCWGMGPHPGQLARPEWAAAYLKAPLRLVQTLQQPQASTDAVLREAHPYAARRRSPALNGVLTQSAVLAPSICR